MSRCLVRIACVVCLILFSVMIAPINAYAQYGGMGSPTPPVYYTIVGTDYRVAPSCGPAYSATDLLCPLRKLWLNDPNKFQAAYTASRAAGDTLGAPFAISADGRDRTYCDMADCVAFFKEFEERLAEGAPSSGGLRCGYLPPGGSARNDCLGIAAGVTNSVKNEVTKLLIQTDTIPENIKLNNLSREQIEKMQAKQAEKQEAEKSCFDGTLDRIGRSWTNQLSGDCVRSASRFIRSRISNKLSNELKHFEQKLAVNLKSDGQGSSPGVIISAPSVVGTAQAAVSAARYAIAIARVATDNSTYLGQMLNDCLNLRSRFGDLQSWRKGVLSGICRSAASLIERQLTQCIRVSVGFDLRLPQFAAALQCPINLSINAYVGSQGSSFNFNCVRQSPVSTLAWGGQSLLASSGGMANIFNGDCFTTNTTPPPGAAPGGRIPGVDCGNLSTDPIRSENLTGPALTGGNAIANGWVVGQSERITTLSGAAQQITRCDFYRNNARERTNYVYGSGSSCNTSATGFTDGGFETNVGCYQGTYEPEGAPNSPDECLYPAACLTDRVFDQNKVGVGACPTNVQPMIDLAARPEYTLIDGTGGFGGGNVVMGSCDGAANDAPVCCDPQKQDCRSAVARRRNPAAPVDPVSNPANPPLCACDQGGSDNTVIEAATGRCDPDRGGGSRTCCTPSLNGGTNGCTTQLGIPASGICAGADQCVGSSVVIGTDQDGDPITAGEANTSKPSPFSYLAIRPDVTLTSITNPDGSPKQCCTTPWCNVCPQHYANAYGLSMARSSWSAPPAPTASLSVVRAYNDTIVGRGWPFTTDTTPAGITTYTPGVNPALLEMTIIGGGGEQLVPLRNPTLHMSTSMQTKLSEEQFADCRNIAGWQIENMDASRFMDSNGELGYAYRSSFGFANRREDWRVHAPVPSPQEAPLDYINRLRTNSVDPDGNQFEPIPLCSEVVKVCTPVAPALVVGGGGGGVPIPPVAVPPVAVPPGGGGAGGGGGGGAGGGSPPFVDPLAVRALPGGGGAGAVAAPAPVATPPAPAPGGGGSPSTPPGASLVPGMGGGGSGTGSLF